MKNNRAIRTVIKNKIVPLVIFSLTCIPLTSTGQPKGSTKGLILTNLTNQQIPLNGNFALCHYNPHKDIFMTGKPYKFSLLINLNRKESCIPFNSIKPFIVINGSKYNMVLSGQYKTFVLFECTIPDRCVNLDFESVHGFKYYFIVGFGLRSSACDNITDSPPYRLPAERVSFYSQVLGSGAFHYDASKDERSTYHRQLSEVVYDFDCLNLDMGCAPSLQVKNYINIYHGWATNPATDYEHNLTLRNLTQKDIKLSRIELASFQNLPDYMNFEIMLSNTLPINVSCEGIYGFKLRYKPGYYRNANISSAPHTEKAIIRTWLLDNNNLEVQGPDLYINYIIDEVVM